MKRYIIKTIGGDRYETETSPTFNKKCDFWWLTFPINDGVGTICMNVSNVMCVIEKETDGEEEKEG